MTSSRDRKVAIVWFRRDLRLADNQALRMALSRGGQSWFLETLTDADLANNTFGWHWTAGCGADAAPFSRIFYPVIQGGKFDPEGTYVRRWVPELERLPSRWIHRPWDAPAEALRTAGVRIGKTYPAPIVDHASARTRRNCQEYFLNMPSSPTPEWHGAWGNSTMVGFPQGIPHRDYNFGDRIAITKIFNAESRSNHAKD